MALGDAIASALMIAKGFSAEDFARSHPAGALGRRLLLNVENVMRTGDNLPVVHTGTMATEAIHIMAKQHLGLFVVVDDNNVPVGIFTEGDLCREIQSGIDFRSLTVDEVMTRTPKTITPEASAYAAMKEIKDFKINQLIVVDAEDGKLLGILHVQDLIAKKVN